MHGTTSEAAASTASPALAGPVQPPKDLTKVERAVWDRLAPKAIAAGTLTETTADDFSQLCRLRVHVDRLYTAFEQAGINEYGLKLERAWRGAVQRLEAKARAYRLGAIGKEIAPPAEAKPQSALEKLQAQRAQLRVVK